MEGERSSWGRGAFFPDTRCWSISVNSKKKKKKSQLQNAACDPCRVLNAALGW